MRKSIEILFAGVLFGAASIYLFQVFVSKTEKVIKEKKKKQRHNGTKSTVKRVKVDEANAESREIKEDSQKITVEILSALPPIEVAVLEICQADTSKILLIVDDPLMIDSEDEGQKDLKSDSVSPEVSEVVAEDTKAENVSLLKLGSQDTELLPVQDSETIIAPIENSAESEQLLKVEEQEKTLSDAGLEQVDEDLESIDLAVLAPSSPTIHVALTVEALVEGLVEALIEDLDEETMRSNYSSPKSKDELEDVKAIELITESASSLISHLPIAMSTSLNPNAFEFVPSFTAAYKIKDVQPLLAHHDFTYDSLSYDQNQAYYRPNLTENGSTRQKSHKKRDSNRKFVLTKKVEKVHESTIADYLSVPNETVIASCMFGAKCSNVGCVYLHVDPTSKSKSSIRKM